MESLELSKFVDALPALVWIARADGGAEFVNRRWCEYTGWVQTMRAATDGSPHIHPNDLALVRERWRGFLQSGQAGDVEARLRRHDGRYRWFHLSASPMADDSGRIVGWCGINTDVEEVKRAATRTQPEAHHRYDTGADMVDRSGRRHRLRQSTLPRLCRPHLGATARPGMGGRAPSRRSRRTHRRMERAAGFRIGRASRGAPAPSRRRVPLVSVAREAAPRRERNDRQMVRRQHRHRRPEAGRGGTAAQSSATSPGRGGQRNRQLSVARRPRRTELVRRALSHLRVRSRRDDHARVDCVARSPGRPAVDGRDGRPRASGSRLRIRTPAADAGRLGEVPAPGGSRNARSGRSSGVRRCFPEHDRASTGGADAGQGPIGSLRMWRAYRVSARWRRPSRTK